MGVVAWSLGVLLLAPLAWTLVASLRPEAQLFGGAGFSLAAEHYRALFETRDFWTPIWNSAVVCFSTTVLCVGLGSMGAYALARLRFPGRDVLLGLVLAVSMFPQISVVAPLYLVLRTAGLINTYPGLVLPYLTFAMPLCVWLLVGFFRQLPPEIEEAALVDGASRLRTFFVVVLPLAAPGVAASGILTFLYCWNEFLFALAFTVGPEHHTVPVAIALFRGQYQVPWGQVLAATMVATVPVAAVVLLFQRFIVAGLTQGAVKG